MYLNVESGAKGGAFSTLLRQRDDDDDDAIRLCTVVYNLLCAERVAFVVVVVELVVVDVRMVCALALSG